MQIQDSPDQWHYQIRCKRKESQPASSKWGSQYRHGRSASYLHGGAAKHVGEWWGWGEGERSRQLQLCEQEFSNALMRIVQQACEYFFEDEWEPMLGVPTSRVSDSEVRRRVTQLEEGELAREARSRNLDPPPLSRLPFSGQRAMIEQIDALADEWQFRILD